MRAYVQYEALGVQVVRVQAACVPVLGGFDRGGSRRLSR